MGRTVAIGGAAFAALLLESVLAPRIAAGLRGPDLLLVLVVYLALREPTARGAATAFAIGYLQDAVAAGFAGPNAFAMTAVFLVVHLTATRLWVENGLSQVVVVMVAWAVKTLALLLVLAVAVPARAAWGPQALGAALQGLAAAVLAPAVFAALARAERRLARAAG